MRMAGLSNLLRIEIAIKRHKQIELRRLRRAPPPTGQRLRQCSGSRVELVLLRLLCLLVDGLYLLRCPSLATDSPAQQQSIDAATYSLTYHLLSKLKTEKPKLLFREAF